MLPDSNLSLILAVGILCLILVLSSGLYIAKFLPRGSSKKGPSGRIPPNQQFFLSRPESMTVVRTILTSEPIVGCRWRITYDRTEEGRMQARLFGSPVGGEGSVDILLNMIFHKLEPFKTEMEWSYVVMSGQADSADRVVDSSNAAFRAGLRSAQFHKSSPAEKLLSSVTSAPIVGPGEVAAREPVQAGAEGEPQEDSPPAASPTNGESTVAAPVNGKSAAPTPANGTSAAPAPANGDGDVDGVKTCFNCHKGIESGFTFCIYCGASVT